MAWSKLSGTVVYLPTSKSIRHSSIFLTTLRSTFISSLPKEGSWFRIRRISSEQHAWWSRRRMQTNFFKTSSGILAPLTHRSWNLTGTTRVLPPRAWNQTVIKVILVHTRILDHICWKFLVAVQHLRTLLSIILTNSEVRKLLSDFSVIGVDLLSKGATHIAQKIAPTSEQLRNVDQSAPDDEFITAGGRPAGPGETPVPEFSVPGTSKTLQQHPKENEPRIVDADGTKKGVGEATQQAQGQYGELRDRAGQIGAEAGHKAQDYADTDSPQDVEEKKTGMREKMRQMGVSPIFIQHAHIITLAFVE